MAAFSPTSVHGLIDRLFYHPRRSSRGRAAAIPHRRSAAAQQLQFHPPLSGEQIDRSWLGRIELRSVDHVIEFLEHGGFPRRHGLVAALFLDKRCGYIAGELIGSAVWKSPEATVRKILKLASFHHANGVILAVNDFHDTFDCHQAWEELASTLSRKGEAIDVFLVDQIVRSGGRWKRLSTDGAEGAATCCS